MRSIRSLLTVGFVCVTFVFIGEAHGGSIRIENGGTADFYYSVRRQQGSWSTKSFRIAPGKHHAFASTEPLVISYWTDKPRYSTIEPDRVYRITDVKSGELKQVTTALRPFAVDVPRVDGTPSERGDSALGEQTPVAPKTSDSPTQEDVRIIRVKAIADATYRKAVRDWRQRIGNVVSGASEYYETNFKIRFVIDDVQDWEYNVLGENLEKRWGHLWSVPPGEADIVIAFIGYELYRHKQGNMYRSIWGQCPPFGQHMVVSGDDLYHLNRDKTVLIHELAHLFGAFHVDNPQSVMQPLYGDIPLEDKIQGRLHMDAPLKQVIQLARNVDFRRGAESLDPETRNRIRLLCRKYRHPAEADCPTPIALSYALAEERERALACDEAKSDQPLAKKRESPASGTSPATKGGDRTYEPPKRTVSLKAGETAIVVADSTELRQGGLTLGVIPKGETLEVLGYRANRVRVIRSPTSIKGWVSSKDLTISPPGARMSDSQTALTEEEVELRTGEHVLGTLPKGVRFKVVTNRGEFVLVLAERQILAEYKGGAIMYIPLQEGWVEGSHLARLDAARR